MFAELHLLRPWCLLLILPGLLMFWKALRIVPGLDSWKDECDPKLLANLIQIQGQKTSPRAWICLFLSLLFTIIACSGPAWQRLPVPAYQPALPRVVVLDMYESMLNTDLPPNRLARAKFKLQDLLALQNSGQMGLVVFTGEPFVVSPLTEDGKTIAALLPMLTLDIMPAQGHNLTSALQEATRLIERAGYQQGQILVMTDSAPDQKAKEEASTLSEQGIITSVMPILKTDDDPAFQQFAKAGQGQLLSLNASNAELEHWLKGQTLHQRFVLDQDNDIPIWKDQGRWFLLPALLLLLPVFRRGFIQRIMV